MTKVMDGWDMWAHCGWKQIPPSHPLPGIILAQSPKPSTFVPFTSPSLMRFLFFWLLCPPNNNSNKEQQCSTGQL